MPPMAALVTCVHVIIDLTLMPVKLAAIGFSAQARTALP